MRMVLSSPPVTNFLPHGDHASAQSYPLKCDFMITLAFSIFYFNGTYKMVELFVQINIFSLVKSMDRIPASNLSNLLT
jgi:hypothetical protein